MSTLPTYHKRLFDVAVVVLTAPFLLPLLAGLMLLVRLKLGRPVFFRQRRPGLYGEVFQLVKFRTMIDQCDGEGRPLPDAERLTSFGRWLRSTSLDELPELINVLRGEMSLVGPRPLMVQYLDRYSAEQRRRHLVLPGITGWAQINGRNNLGWEDRFKLDVWYVDHHSFLLDCRILALTFGNVLMRKGITAKGEATMPEFDPQPSTGSPSSDSSASCK